MSSVITIRISDETKNDLDQLADATGRSKSFLAFEAIKKYLGLEGWQIAETKKAIMEADAGLFATDADVDAVKRKWQV